MIVSLEKDLAESLTDEGTNILMNWQVKMESKV
jgi:hypothetical protein